MLRNPVNDEGIKKILHNTIRTGWCFFVQKTDKICEFSQAGVKKN